LDLLLLDNAHITMSKMSLDTFLDCFDIKFNQVIQTIQLKSDLIKHYKSRNQDFWGHVTQVLPDVLVHVQSWLDKANSIAIALKSFPYDLQRDAELNHTDKDGVVSDIIPIPLPWSDFFNENIAKQGYRVH
jgi:hypothetical protein